MKTKSLLTSGSKGFSLVELLVVIAVIAIIAAIAIPNIANVTASANAAKDQRNAQTIASVAAAARAAGYSTLWVSNTGAANQLSGTVSVLVGNNTMVFSVPALTSTDLAGACNFLEVTTGTPDVLVYSSTSFTGTN